MDSLKLMQQFAQLYALADKERFPSLVLDGDERPSTLFYADFKVDEPLGPAALRGTMRRCGDIERLDMKEVGELVVALDHLAWEADRAGRTAQARTYTDLYHKSRDALNKRVAAIKDEDEKQAAEEYVFKLLAYPTGGNKHG